MSAKYTVNFRAPFTARWSKGAYESLAGALVSAWRKHKKDCSVDNITYEREVVINSEELARSFTRMDNLARELPKRQPHELAERVIQEMDKVGAQTETWQASSAGS